jgi:hypothetical protein
MMTNKNSAMVKGEETEKQPRSKVRRAVVGVGGAAAFLALRGKVKRRHGSFGYDGKKVATPGMWKNAGKEVVGKAKDAVTGAVKEGARRTKNAAARVEGRMTPKPKAWEKEKFWAGRGGPKKRGKFADPSKAYGLSALLERCRELADGESKDRMGRFVLGTPIMGALKAPKGKRMEAFKKLKGHEAGETLKGAGKGGVVGAGAGALLAAAAAAKGKGKLVKRGGRARKVVMGRSGNEALRGAAAGAVVGGGAGLVGGSVKGHMGKKADELYVKAKRGELSAVVERCRELALAVNERGEYPWQAHKREKRREQVGQVAKAAVGAGAGLMIHRGVQNAGGYQKMGQRFNAVRRAASEVAGQGPIESTYRAGRAVARKVGKGVMQDVNKAGGAVKSAAQRAAEMLRKRGGVARGVGGLLK